MIKIFIDKEKNSLEIKGTVIDLIAEIGAIIEILKTDETLGALYPVAKYFEEQYAKNNTSN